MKSIAIAVAITVITIGLVAIDPWLFNGFKSIAPDWPPALHVAAALEHVLNNWVVIAGIVLYSLLSRTHRLRRCGLLFGVCLTQAILISLLKKVFSRMRPDDLVASAGFFGPQWSGEHNSFPSGHAAASFALAAVFATWHPKWRWPFYTLACMITLARIYLGRHFFSDCFIGGCLGYWIAQAFMHHLWQKPDAPGHAPDRPGPTQ